ncbi:MAG: cellulase family glycosylhydrolase [Clostridia bacterium]|nr:cellulase family glycosylhydrolase [Clostridia bacterium]
MKKIIVFLCLLAVLLPLTAAKGNDMEETRYGFHVEEDGTVTLAGEPFYGFGVNYFGAFARYVESESQSTKEYEAGLAGLASYNIPFIRIPLCAYYPSYYELFDSDPDRVFAYLDKVLDECVKKRIGVIGSLMWWDAVIPAHVGEKRSDIGVTGSKTLEYAKNYTKAIVERYKDHPAIWGWEIGNEYNLDADLCDKEFKIWLWPEGISGMPLENINGYDYFTSEELRTFYTEIAKVIREYDDYRMITTGNGEMRPFAYAVYKSSQKKSADHTWEMKWNGNTRKQFDQMNAYFTPDPIDTLCFHLQSGSSDGSRTYVTDLNMFGKTISSEEYFRAYYETAKSLGKACYFGEFGDMLEMETAPDVIDKFREVTDAISASGIQIASLWQFQDYTDEGVAGEKLAVLSELNLKLKADGKQKTGVAWGEKAEETETETETVKETVTETAEQNKPQNEKKKPDIGLIVGLSAAAAAVVAAGVAIAVIVKKKKK